MKFNINNNVRVKLTDFGRSILEQEYEALRKIYPKIKEYRERTVDEEGYTRFQMWSLMNYFGQYMYNGAVLPFETDIIIEE